MNWFDVIVLSLVEGITEFLPVSSTGHMIIAQSLLGIENSEFLKTFIVNIQFGAILSVIVLYLPRFFNSFRFYLKLFVAFLPAAVIGFLFSDRIDSLLENVLVVGLSLFLGGIILLFADKWFHYPSQNQEVSYAKALKIGLFQCIAMIPGVSRSAATIIGGMTQKLNRKTAAEFSFFLAVPTMFAASAYKLLKNHHAITHENIVFLIAGNIISFLVAMLAIKTFISLLTRYGFKIWGWYRIVVGGIIILLIALGYPLSIL